MAKIMEKDNLTILREEIDKADEEISSLLKKRFLLCEKIKKEKAAKGAGITDSLRESAVYEHIGGLFENEKHKKAAVKIYEAIIENCKDLQK